MFGGWKGMAKLDGPGMYISPVVYDSIHDCARRCQTVLPVLTGGTIECGKIGTPTCYAHFLNRFLRFEKPIFEDIYYYYTK